MTDLADSLRKTADAMNKAYVAGMIHDTIDDSVRVPLGIDAAKIAALEAENAGLASQVLRLTNEVGALTARLAERDELLQQANDSTASLIDCLRDIGEQIRGVCK